MLFLGCIGTRKKINCCVSTAVFFMTKKHRILRKKIETSFTKNGFSNWKKGVQKFKIHRSSDLHANAVDAFLKRQDENTCIISHLDKNVEKNQTAARECLEIFISTIKYLVRQSIALRGKDEKSGNFIELLRLRAESNDNLKSWLAKFDGEKTRQRLYLSHDIQNEIISDTSREIFLPLKFEIRQSKYFCFICDGTQDVLAGLEQGMRVNPIC